MACRLWGNFNMTHAKNKVILKDDAMLTPNYQKEAGYSMGQYRSYIDRGFINNIDDLIGSPAQTPMTITVWLVTITL